MAKSFQKKLARVAIRKKFATFALTKPRWRNGRRARFRCECREACRFESYSGHLKRSSLRRAPFSFARIGLVQSVAVWHSYLRLRYCSVGVLLRNRRLCADSQKVNKFPFNYHPNPCNFVVRLRSNFTLLALLSASAAVRVGCGERVGCAN